jgi:antirestriction protein
MENAPRIYVSSFAKYNAGSLAGAWLDLNDYADKDDFIAAAEALVKEPDPELMFSDWESIPDGMVGECWINAEVWEWVALDDNERKIVKLYRDNVDSAGSIEDALEAYSGEYEREIDWAYEYVDGAGLLSDAPEVLANYFDYDAFLRDAKMDMSFVWDGSNYVVFNR